MVVSWWCVFFVLFDDMSFQCVAGSCKVIMQFSHGHYLRNHATSHVRCYWCVLPRYHICQIMQEHNILFLKSPNLRGQMLVVGFLQQYGPSSINQLSRNNQSSLPTNGERNNNSLFRKTWLFSTVGALIIPSTDISIQCHPSYSTTVQHPSRTTQFKVI